MKILHGDSREVLKTLEAASIDSVVCDPPYALVSIAKRFGADNAAPAQFGRDGAYARASAGFMGKKWDTGEVAFDPAFWVEVLRVLKPGGHLLAFGGTRSYHRLACAVEDAGFEIRDQIGWLYGSGFPKSHDVSKGIDAKLGAERTEIVGVKPGHEGFANRGNMSSVQSLKGTLGGEGGFARPWMDDPEQVEKYHHKFAPATKEAQEWEGWGTALKPAWEPIVLARKPLAGTVAENVLQFRTGALNIDGCRVETSDNLNGGAYAKNATKREELWSGDAGNSWRRGGAGEFAQPEGRWPANVIHDGSAEVISAFPAAPGQQRYVGPEHGDRLSKGIYGDFGPRPPNPPRVETDKSAARFFYCAKASKADRNEGCDGLPEREGGMRSETSGQHITRRDGGDPKPVKNHHPTVKPTALMAYLCRLVTPPGGTVLDPFMGSGSTGKAAVREGFDFVGIEREADYYEIAMRRIGAEMLAA